MLAWCILQTLAESSDPKQEHPARSALALFDRLHLREPLAKAFQAVGMEGDGAWRAAARIKLLLLVESHAEAGTTETSLPKIIPDDLWQDPDLRWLTGVHEAEGHDYIVREPYEELLWFLSLPTLLHIAALEPENYDIILSAQQEEIEESLTDLAAASYRLDKLTAPEPVEESEPADDPELETEPEPEVEQGSVEPELSADESPLPKLEADDLPEEQNPDTEVIPEIDRDAEPEPDSEANPDEKEEE